MKLIDYLRVSAEEHAPEPTEDQATESDYITALQDLGWMWNEKIQTNRSGSNIPSKSRACITDNLRRERK